LENINFILYSIADVTSIQNIFRDTSALVLPPPILLASLCVLGGLKEVNTGVDEVVLVNSRLYYYCSMFLCAKI